MDFVKLVVGLGNPGKKYAKTRHNIGFRVVDQIVESLVPSGRKWHLDERLSSTYIICPIKARDVIIAKPTTFMNESGLVVKALAEHFGLLPEDIMIVHDDKDIILGEYKIQINRGAAGHNGIKSIISHLGTQKFHRLRVGIANTNKKKMKDKVKFVLGRFGLFERSLVKKVVNNTSEQIINLI